MSSDFNKRLQTATVREIKVEDHLREGAEARDGFCLKLNSAWYVGIPDRVLLLPGGLVVFVETKTIGGVVSGKQGWWHRRLRALGFRVEIIWTKQQVDEFYASIA